MGILLDLSSSLPLPFPSQSPVPSVPFTSSSQLSPATNRILLSFDEFGPPKNVHDYGYLKFKAVQLVMYGPWRCPMLRLSVYKRAELKPLLICLSGPAVASKVNS